MSKWEDQNQTGIKINSQDLRDKSWQIFNSIKFNPVLIYIQFENQNSRVKQQTRILEKIIDNFYYEDPPRSTEAVRQRVG